jgi:pimeloyl-ACP methyl ester carboxylesterase
MMATTLQLGMLITAYRNRQGRGMSNQLKMFLDLTKSLPRRMVDWDSCDRIDRQRRCLVGYGLSAILLALHPSGAYSEQRKLVKTGFDVNRLSVSTGGTGEPALFIHGFGSSKYTWFHVCQGMKDILTYYAIDLPGSGSSPAPADFVYSLENFADVVADFILTKDLENLTLVGTSLGGGVALLTLLRHSQELSSRIKAICLIDSIAYPQSLPFFVGLLRIPLFGPLAVDLIPGEVQARAVLSYCYFNDALITPEQVQEYAGYFRRRDARTALQKTARLIDQERLSAYMKQFATITKPCLLIWGREDKVVPLDIGQRLARDLPHSELVVIDRCGHMPQEECSRELIAPLRRFIQSRA